MRWVQKRPSRAIILAGSIAFAFCLIAKMQMVDEADTPRISESEPLALESAVASGSAPEDDSDSDAASTVPDEPGLDAGRVSSAEAEAETVLEDSSPFVPLALPPSSPEAVRNDCASSTELRIDEESCIPEAAESNDAPMSASSKPPPAGSASPAPKGSEHELRKFGLGPQDKVLESYSCALYPKKGLLTHGRMFITQHFVAFAGWKDMRVLLPMRNVLRIEKTNTLLYIPNALTIILEDKGGEYFFGSFIDRDACVQMLKNLVEIERRIIEIHGHDATLEARGLEFGYQTRQPSRMSTGGLSFQSFLTTMVAHPAASASAPATTSGVQAVPAETAEASSPDPPAAEGSVSAADDSPVPPMPAVSPPQQPSPARTTPKEVPAADSPTKPLPPPLPPAPTPAPPAAVPAPRVDVSALTGGSAVQWLWNQDLLCPGAHLWKPCWLYACGYGDFLRDEGALDLKYTEWTPFCGSVDEDVHSKLKFNFSREFVYAFPRTTMLMFGPKFAPIKQTQYLFIPEGSSLSSFEALEAALPQQAVVLFVTKFEGIPMADVFKVLQYWVIDSKPSTDEHDMAIARHSVHIQVGVAIHYVKSSMFKSQILSGTKDEVGGQIKKYVLYAELRAAEFKRALDQEQFGALESDAAVVSAARRRYSGRVEERPPSMRISPASAEQLGVSGTKTSAATPPRPEYVLYGVDITDIVLLWPQIVVGLLLCWLIYSNRCTGRAVSSLESKVSALEQALDEHNALLRALLKNPDHQQ